MSRTKYLKRSASILALMLFYVSTSIAQSVVAHIPLGRTPTSIAVNPVTNRVYAASKSLLSSSLQVIDGSTNTISATLSLTFQPEAIEVNPTQLQELIQKVQQYNFAQGVANSLDSKLQNALAALESLNTETSARSAINSTHSSTKSKRRTN